MSVSCVGLRERSSTIASGPPIPILTTAGPLSPAQDKAVIARALGESANEAAIELIEAVRRDAKTPLIADNAVSLLIDGPQTFAAIEKAISGARHHIHVETYIFSDDELGRRFAALLTRKRREGVEVRVLYDGVGSLATPSRFFDELREAGIEVLEFRPLNPVKTPLLWKLNNRDHRKIVVVDGRVGFTGGVNISGTYARGSGSKPGPVEGLQDGWRDTHVQINGPAVQQLQALFFQGWTRAGGHVEDVSRPNYFPSVATNGSDLVAVLANDSDNSTDRTLYFSYLSAIDHAAQRIWMTQAYFAPNEALLSALCSAAQRGVDVRLIVPGFTDSTLILNASRSTYSRLLKCGTKIYEQRDALLHAKTVVLDGIISTVGSANFDMRSFLHNNEANAMVIGHTFGERMEAMFTRDQNAATQITLEQWRKRPWWERFKERTNSLLSYWL